MARRRRAMLMLGALAAAAAHCSAAPPPPPRRLLSFDSAVTDTVTDVAGAAVDTASNLVSSLASTVLGTTDADTTAPATPTTGPTTTEPSGGLSASVSLTIGGATGTSTSDDLLAIKLATSSPAAETTTTPSFNDDSGTPTGIADSVPVVTTATPSSGISVAVTVSLTGSGDGQETLAPTTRTPAPTTTPTPTTERPTSAPTASPTTTAAPTTAPTAAPTAAPTSAPTTAPTTALTLPPTVDGTGNESAEYIGSDSAAPTAAPAPTPTTQEPTISLATLAPVAVSVPTLAPTTVSVATQAPATDVSVSVSTPVAVPVPTSASKSTDAPVAATDAPVVATDAPVVSTELPVPVPVSTDIPVTAATDVPVVVPVSTETPMVVPVSTEISTTAPITVALPTQAPATTQAPTPAADSPTSSLSGAPPDRDIADDQTDAPVATGSTSTDAAVVLPDESTAAPLATTSPPVVNAGSAIDTPAAGATVSPRIPSTSTGSLGSSRNNETVILSSHSGSEDQMSPGHVHASSSADVSLDGSSDELNFGSSDAIHSDKQKKTKKKQDARSSSGDYSTNSSNKADPAKLSSTSTSTSNSNSGSSRGGSNAFGGILNPGGVSDVNTSSATYYSLGTGSIVAIVGVIAGIAGVLVLFVAISRKKYTDEDDDSPIPFGVDIRTMARLSPTFMQDDSFMESGYNDTALMVAVPPQTNQFDGVSSTSGESSDEVPSLRGCMMNASHCDPLADVSIRSRVPTTMSFSGEEDAGNVRTSALYSAGGSSMTSSSAISSWSSVLGSDTERQTMRNTRDTSLSAWSATNLSSFGSTASGGSGLHRLTRSSSTLSADIRHTGGSDRSRGYSGPTLPAPQEEEASRVAAGPIDSSRSNESTEV